MKIAEIKTAVSQVDPPDRAFATVKDRQSGKQKLGVNCSYCSHKQTCWEELDVKFRSGRPVFLVPREETSAPTF